MQLSTVGVQPSWQQGQVCRASTVCLIPIGDIANGVGQGFVSAFQVCSHHLLLLRQQLTRMLGESNRHDGGHQPSSGVPQRHLHCPSSTWICCSKAALASSRVPSCSGKPTNPNPFKFSNARLRMDYTFFQLDHHVSPPIQPSIGLNSRSLWNVTNADPAPYTAGGRMAERASPTHQLHSESTLPFSLTAPSRKRASPTGAPL